MITTSLFHLHTHTRTHTHTHTLKVQWLMLVYSVISCEQCRKKNCWENTTLSFHWKVHKVFYILLQYPFSLQMSRSIQQWRRKWKKKQKTTDSPSQHTQQECNDRDRLCVTISSEDVASHYCTQVNVQIYTDSGVMYKNKNGQSKAIC